MPRAGRPISLCGWDDELAPAAHLHSGNTVLPTLDEAAQREFDGLAAAPRAVELFTGVVLDTHVMHLYGAAWAGFGSIADHQVFNDEFCGRWAARKFDLWFAWHSTDPSPAHWTGGRGPESSR